MSIKLLFTPELGGTLLSNDSNSDNFDSIISNPVEFIKSTYNVDIISEIKTVENTDNEINLVLPFYTDLEKLSTSALSENDLDSISGGEIFISTVVIGTGLAIWGGIGTGTAAAYESAHGRNLDGSKK